MSASNALISSVPNIKNYCHLALFICQLFTDGNFRNGQILYDPNVFDGDFVTEIESICPHSFPWRTADITLPIHPFMLPWILGERVDFILQLIFLDPKYMAVEFNQIKDYFTSYRIFVFSSTDEIDTEAHISVIKNLNRVFTSILVLHYNLESGSIHIHWIPSNYDAVKKIEERMSVDPKAISIRNQKNNIDHVNLFDRTFGEYDRKHAIIIRHGGLPYGNNKFTELVGLSDQNLFLLNYFLLNLNGLYMALTYVNTSDPDLQMGHKQRKYYKELLDAYYPINLDKNTV